MSSAVNYGVSDMCTASASATAPFNGEGPKDSSSGQTGYEYQSRRTCLNNFISQPELNAVACRAHLHDTTIKLKNMNGHGHRRWSDFSGRRYMPLLSYTKKKMCQKII